MAQETPYMEVDMVYIKSPSVQMVKDHVENFDDRGNRMQIRRTAGKASERRETRYFGDFKNTTAALATAIEQSSESIFITDTARIIQYVNPSFERMTGFSREEVIGKTPDFLRSNAHDSEFYEEIGLHAGMEKAWSGRITNRKKDGTLYLTETTISPIRDASGSIIHYVNTKRDVTAEIRMEHQLRQAQKMEAIGNLAGGIAHDFNNILAAMIGYTEMALEDAAELKPIREKLQKVMKAGERARNLIMQILTFSSRQEPEKKTVHLKAIVMETLGLLRATLPSTIEIIEGIHDPSGVICADPTQIQQVLMNLCTNASHSMRENGGVLTVGLENIEIDTESASRYLDLAPGPYVRLNVSDTGKGMDSRVLERIFEPFFTTKQPGEGTGMGLSVVHGILKSHHGAITVYSEPGIGTSFHVYLPRIDGDIAAPSELRLPPTGSGEHILLVDDEVMLVDMAGEMLEKLGYRVSSVSSATKALENFSADPDGFDLVITDQTMPKLSGDKLARRIMDIRRDIPIILCTGFSEVMHREKAESMGIRAYVTKPFTRQKIAETIRSVLDRTGQ